MQIDVESLSPQQRQAALAIREAAHAEMRANPNHMLQILRCYNRKVLETLAGRNNADRE